MTFDEFLDIVFELTPVYRIEKFQKLVYVRDRKDAQGDNVIYKEWTIGGFTGGDCWGGESHRPVTAEDEPNFNQLDDILEKVNPNITFLQYKQIGKLIKDFESSDGGDFYGNYYLKKVKYITLIDLYNFLVEKK